MANKDYTIVCTVKPVFNEAKDNGGIYDTLDFSITYESPYTGQIKTRTSTAVGSSPNNEAFYTDVLHILNDINEVEKYAKNAMALFLAQDWDEISVTTPVEDPKAQQIRDLVKIKTYTLEITTSAPAQE